LQRVFEQMLRAPPARLDAIARRIVHVCGSLQPGGAERQLVYVLQGLSRSNCESVQLLCHHLSHGENQYDFYAPAIAAAGVPAREIRRSTARIDLAGLPAGLRETARLLPAGLVADIADLYREFTDLRPEVVHAWLDWDNVRSGLAAVLAGVPKVILSGRNINPSHFELYQPYMDPAYKALAQIPRVSFVNNSRAGADNYADWIGIPRDRIRVVHNGVDFGNRRRLSALQAGGLRASLGIAADAFVVGGVFRLEAEKRPLLWVDTAARVAEKLPDARFLIYGQGRMHQRLVRAANRAGLGKRLILPGLTSDVVSAMSIMDVLLLTSSGEGLPNVLLEAQWSGTPVVTTDVGGAKEAIYPDVTGWAIKTDAPHELADRITWLHGNPQVRAAALDRCPAFVRTNFSVERMVSEITKLYGLS
jgi:glycosyltransferase involved in cell wall biosynthesis